MSMRRWSTRWKRKRMREKFRSESEGCSQIRMSLWRGCGCGNCCGPWYRCCCGSSQLSWPLLSRFRGTIIRGGMLKRGHDFTRLHVPTRVVSRWYLVRYYRTEVGNSYMIIETSKVRHKILAEATYMQGYLQLVLKVEVPNPRTAELLCLPVCLSYGAQKLDPYLCHWKDLQVFFGEVNTWFFTSPDRILPQIFEAY